MPTQSHSKFRLYLLVSVAVLLLCALAVFVAFERHRQDEVAQQFPAKIEELVGDATSGVADVPAAEVPIDKTPVDWEPEKDHPVVASTDFYFASDAPDVEVDPLLRYNEHQVGVEMSMLVFILQDGDLLANHCLNGCREFVTDQQVLEAQLLTRQYDATLKEIRRQRAAVLEQAGVSIDDPEEELALIRIKAFSVFFEAKRRIFQEVLNAEQRKLIVQKFQTIQREARRIKEAKQAAQKTKMSQQ